MPDEESRRTPVVGGQAGADAVSAGKTQDGSRQRCATSEDGCVVDTPRSRIATVAIRVTRLETRFAKQAWQFQSTNRTPRAWTGARSLGASFAAGFLESGTDTRTGRLSDRPARSQTAREASEGASKGRPRKKFP